MCAMFVGDSKQQKFNGHYEVPSEGPHPAELVRIKDVGMVETRFGSVHRLRWVWQLEDELDSSGKPKVAFQNFNKPKDFGEKSHLFKAVRQLLGYAPPKPFDLESLLGTKATICIEHGTNKEGVVFANVSTVIRQPEPKPQVDVQNGSAR